MAKVIHQEVVVSATATRVYEALTNSKQFSQFTGGAPADIVAQPGGSFSCFGGMIEGRNIELLPGKRIVQAWRARNWPEGVYSIARFELKDKGGETRLVFDHTGFPEDELSHLEAGWQKMYWEPLKQLLGS